LITPGKIGEFGRAFHMNDKKTVTLPTIIIEKIQDICVLLVLSTVTILYFFQDSSYMMISIFLISLGVFGLILISINERCMLFLGKKMGISQEDMGDFILNFKKILNDHPTIFKSMFITVLYYIIAYFFAFFVVLSASMKISCVFVMPVVVLMGNIPITISGLGLRESMGSFTFVLLGESAANGFVFSILLFFFITVLPAIYGYLITMSGGINDRI
jgi:hypothetical protein